MPGRRRPQLPCLDGRQLGPHCALALPHRQVDIAHCKVQRCLLYWESCSSRHGQSGEGGHMRLTSRRGRAGSTADCPASGHVRRRQMATADEQGLYASQLALYPENLFLPKTGKTIVTSPSLHMGGKRWGQRGFWCQHACNERCVPRHSAWLAWLHQATALHCTALHCTALHCTHHGWLSILSSRMFGKMANSCWHLHGAAERLSRAA